MALIDGNEYFLKVLCEHRLGGFVRLILKVLSEGVVLHPSVYECEHV